MAIGEEEIRRVAELARLELSEEEVRTYTAQLARVVEHIDQLEEFAGVDEEMAVGLREQADEEAPGIDVDRFLANAPEQLDRFLVVPQVKKADG